jgi:hypothetical protein
VPIEIRNHGGGHSYRRTDTGEKVPSVTASKDGGIPKPGLMKWHSETAAAYAVDHWEELSKLPPVERYNVIRKSPYTALNRAGTKGSTVHKFADRLLAGEDVDVPVGLIGYVRSAAAFITEFDFQADYTEAVVHSADEYDHAGKLDALGSLLLPDLPEYDRYAREDDGRVSVLIDWKTSASGVFGDVAYQLAPYRHSRWMVLADGTEIEMPHVELAIAVHLTLEGYTAWPLDTDESVYRDFLFIKEVSRIVDESKYLRGDPLIPPRANRYTIEKADR